jgi:membrane-associated protease RseP (regulator of RpoE activity)
VRLASCLSPLFGCVLLAWAATWAGGTGVPTTTISVVVDGPASAAGMRDGDRVVSVDGRPVNDWEELRASVRRGPLEKRILVERSGQRLLLVLERSAAGTIGVKPTYRQETIGAWRAFRQAADLPIPVYRAMLAAVTGTSPEPVEVKGAIGMMRATESQQSGTFVMFLALLGMTWWPCVLAVHVFDAATLQLFVRSHSAALADPDRVARLCRLHQALALALAGSLGFVILGLFLRLPLVSAVVLPFVLVSFSATLSLYPVVWITSRQRLQASAGWVAALLKVATLIPAWPRSLPSSL